MDPTSTVNLSVSFNKRFSLIERVFIRLMRRLHSGSLKIEFPSGSFAVVGNISMPLADIKITDSKFFRYVLSGGSVGFGEAYVNGLWTTSDLSALLLLLAKNQDDAERLHKGFSIFTSIFSASVTKYGEI